MPDTILYAQHGWADGPQAIASLARQLAGPETQVVAPDLGYLRTWLRIEPLIATVEAIAAENFAAHPTRPVQIIGHSMGGLIWLEVLHRHPEWWSQIASLVLVGSPIGGADLGRLLDPFEWGIGIARDLGRNRRRLAEAVAAKIPTLVIAGDADGGSDGTIPIASTQVRGAKFVCLPGVAHAALRTHPTVATTIAIFWAHLATVGMETPLPPDPVDHADRLVQQLQNVPGMTDAHWRDFSRSVVHLTCQDGTTVRLWKNPIGIDHVFVGCPQGTCLYAGFVGWLHANELQQTINTILQEFGAARLSATQPEK